MRDDRRPLDADVAIERFRRGPADRKQGHRSSRAERFQFGSFVRGKRKRVQKVSGHAGCLALPTSHYPPRITPPRITRLALPASHYPSRHLTRSHYPPLITHTHHPPLPLLLRAARVSKR